MDNSKILIYDGSFNGFLTSVFVAFEEKIQVVDIQRSSIQQNGLFSDSTIIFTHVEKAKRVWNGIDKKSHRALKNIYFAFMSESKNVELLLYRYIRKLFAKRFAIQSDYSDDIVLKIVQLAKSVGREKHRMEAFVRFQLTKDDIYFATIEPDFDVLPLISKHFRSRYADQHWLIYDVKRKYGIFYNLTGVEIVSLDLQGVFANSILRNDCFITEEYSYQELWANYFKSTNIRSRINPKLHAQHVPRRYWKYLSEKKQVV
ncbi:TIGR03915 family putative DNA repair protein [Pareuzebyella sediminis]|uniref:TIGR03915 family putative DNA repair protein n=1 Tax=Pareuzebyella sediminis TaxID=2607998 RepID=UPI0011EEF624|nr:TIGR03915 family putative DNA repair protein [Pareuzebyella sediminis]